MTDFRAPADDASELRTARDELVAFVLGCPPARWTASGAVPDDPRPVGVIADHVADAYGYLAGWLRELVAGGSPTVSTEIVDGLNARHAEAAAGVTQQAAAAHLRTSGDELARLVERLTADDLAIGEGRVGRLVRIAIRHTNDHRAELERAVAGSGGSN